VSITLPGTKTPLSTEDIRAFLRDQPNYNILLDTVEFEDDDLNRGVRFATAKYNGITPITTLTASQINEWVLLCGVCCVLFRSEGARQLRNQVTAQDGNIAPVGIDEKQALYAQWSEWFCQEFDTMAKNIKIQNNMESMYYGEGGPGFGSGYRYIGRWMRW